MPATTGAKAAALQFSTDLAVAVALTTKAMYQLDTALLLRHFQQPHAIVGQSKAVGHRPTDGCWAARSDHNETQNSGR